MTPATLESCRQHYLRVITRHGYLTKFTIGELPVEPKMPRRPVNADFICAVCDQASKPMAGVKLGDSFIVRCQHCKVRQRKVPDL